MVREVVAWLGPRPGGLYVDGTIGGGGHAAAILDASAPDGRVIGFDRDADALEATGARLAGMMDRVRLERGNFSEMAERVEWGSCDGVLLDLGVSSHQLDTASRGFGLMVDGPLDMRMDVRGGVTAADLVARLSAAELADVFYRNAGETDSRRIARAIVAERERRAIRTTRELAEIVERVSPRMGRKSHPATRVFQALRVEVNDEVDSLRRGLAAAVTVLKVGGRLLVITFDSLHDRVTKDFMRGASREYRVRGDVDIPELREPRAAWGKEWTRKAVQPSEAEVENNPRARSAQLRVMEKLGDAKE